MKTNLVFMFICGYEVYEDYNCGFWLIDMQRPRDTTGRSTTITLLPNR